MSNNPLKQKNVVRPFKMHYDYKHHESGLTTCELTFYVIINNDVDDLMYNVVEGIAKKRLSSKCTHCIDKEGNYLWTICGKAMYDNTRPYYKRDDKVGENIARARARKKLFNMFYDIHSDIYYCCNEIMEKCLQNKYITEIAKENRYIEKQEKLVIEESMKDARNINVLSEQLPQVLQIHGAEYYYTEASFNANDTGREFFVRYTDGENEMCFRGATELEVYEKVMVLANGAFQSSLPIYSENNT